MPNITDFIGEQGQPRPRAPSGAMTDPLGLARGQAGQPVSYLDRYAQERQKRLEEIEQMSPLRRFFGPGMERQDIMKELLTVEDMKRKQGASQMQAEAENRKQQAEMQKQSREGRTFIFDKLDKLDRLPPNKRALFAPVYAELIGDMLDRSGAANADQLKKLVTAAFNNPDTSKLLRSQMADTAYEEHDFQEITDQLGLQDEAQWASIFDKKRTAKVKEYERTIAVALPKFVARLKANGTLAPTPGDLMTQAEGMLGDLGKSAIVIEAYVNVVNRMTPEQQIETGLTPGKVALAGQVKAAEVKALGPETDKRTATILSGKGLTRSTATPEQIEAARIQAGVDELKLQRERGLTAEQIKLNQIITPETRAKHVRVSALLQTGELVQPEAGMTEQALRKDPDIVAIDDKQRESLTALKPSRVLLDSFQGLAKRLIVATNPIEAAQQGLRLYAGALTGANPEAKAYLDAGEGFLSLLSRALGGERGVLTNLDRTVMRRAAVATFFDTADSRDYKAAIINDIWQASNNAVVQQIAGKGGVAEFRSNLDALLQKLDQASTASLAKGIPADHKLAINRKTGKVNVVPRRDKLTEGWEEVK